MLFEYAITNGEGTLIDYGVLDIVGLMTKDFAYLVEGYIVHIAECDENCQTGI